MNDMKYTSAEAAKLLRKLTEEKSAILELESQSKEFVASLGEDVESIKPEYDYKQTQIKLDAVEKKIRTVKHAINLFNATHTVPGFNMTVDEMLVYIPMLTERRNKLAEMKSKLPKTRDQSDFGRNSNIIDYRYANYEIDAAASDFERISDELSRAQLALDKLNGSETFEIEI